jgi:hypothetical protein
MSCGAAVPSTPEGRRPRRPPARTRRRASWGPGRLGASPSRATTSPPARAPAVPRCPPADAAGAGPASTHRARAHGAPPRPGGWALSPAPRRHRAHASRVLSRLPRASAPGTTPGPSGQRAPQAPAWSRPRPSQPQRGARRAGGLFYAPAGLGAGPAWLAPRSSARHAPSRAPPAGRPPRRGRPPACAALPSSGVARQRAAPTALPPWRAGPPGRDGAGRCARPPARSPPAGLGTGQRRGRLRPPPLEPR